MSEPWPIHEKLVNVLAQSLGDEEAASWVLERRLDRVDQLRERFPERCLALLSFDIDRIKEFVFASAKPLEIQGASAMVKDLEAAGEAGEGRLLRKLLDKQGIPSEAVIFSGGGTGLLLLPDQQAAGFAEALQKGFAEHSGTGTCSVVWQAFAPYELITGPEGSPGEPKSKSKSNPPAGTELIRVEKEKPIRFGEILRLLADRLREVKEEKAWIASPPLPGWLQRCESCGREAASTEDRLWLGERGEEPDRLCGHCKAKRDRGREERKQLEREGRETAISIQDLVEPEERRDKRNYFAVLYGDVNDLGSVLFELESLLDYALFSRAVRKVMAQAVDELVQKFSLRKKYQAPVVGGDDLLLLLPAAKAPHAVRHLLERIPALFQEEAQKIRDQGAEEAARHLEGINISVGFVIVPTHFPIRFAVDYAEELLRSAKKGLQKHGEPCVDYLVLKDASPLSLPVEGLRRAYLERETPEWKIRLTRKPVTDSQFVQMLEDAERLRKAVSRVQLQQVETLLQTASPQEIRLNLRYQWLRLDEWKRFFGSGSGDEGEVLRKAEEWLRDFVLVSPDPNLPNDLETGFLDLLELYDLEES